MRGDRALTEYVLHIRLGSEIEPAIWRRIVVPGSITLRQLHHVFQITMGWTHSHLYEFEVFGSQKRSTRYGDPDEWDGDEGILDDQEVLLSQIASRTGAKFLYTYDIGDDWTHYVTVEEKRAATESLSSCYAECIGGQRAAPPEDVGGEQGYKEFLEAWGDPLHPEHQERREWVGEHYQPELFSVQQANSALAFFTAIYSPDDLEL